MRLILTTLILKIPLFLMVSLATIQNANADVFLCDSYLSTAINPVASNVTSEKKDIQVLLATPSNTRLPDGTLLRAVNKELTIKYLPHGREWSEVILDHYILNGENFVTEDIRFNKKSKKMSAMQLMPHFFDDNVENIIWLTLYQCQ